MKRAVDDAGAASPQRVEARFRRPFKRTWIQIALAAGAKSECEAEHLLWCGSAFPFSGARLTWYQLRHALRHRRCIGDIEAYCHAWPHREIRRHKIQQWTEADEAREERKAASAPKGAP